VVRTGALLRLLCAKALICGAVLCHAQSYSTSASGTSDQTIPAVNGGNPFAGSVPTKLVAGRMPLSLQDAIKLGLRHNLGLLLSRADTRAARGQRWQELSALLPQVTAAPYVAESKINLAEVGLGNAAANVFHISPAVGPFSYFDARASVTHRTLRRNLLYRVISKCSNSILPRRTNSSTTVGSWSSNSKCYAAASSGTASPEI
jgi:hypothetical protein